MSKSVATKKKLFDAIKKSLARASKQSQEKWIGTMWNENIFRYVIVQELEKKKVWGKLAADNKSPRLILERRYGKKGTENRSKSKWIDIASINTKKSTGKQAKSNSLVVEVKAQKPNISWSDFHEEILRCKKFLDKKHGKYFYDLGAVVQGGKISGSINPKSKSHMSIDKTSDVLIGYLDDKGKAIVRWWHSTPVSGKKSGSSNKSSIKSAKINRSAAAKKAAATRKANAAKRSAAAKKAAATRKANAAKRSKKKK